MGEREKMKNGFRFDLGGSNKNEKRLPKMELQMAQTPMTKGIRIDMVTKVGQWRCQGMPLEHFGKNFRSSGRPFVEDVGASGAI